MKVKLIITGMPTKFMPIEPNDTIGSFVDREDSPHHLPLKKIKRFYLFVDAGFIPVDMSARLKDGDMIAGSPPVTC